MRPSWLLAAAVLATAAPAARAADQHFFDDAALHAVQFVSLQEGWAVGDEGVIWHSTDGGERWERQPSGTAASLRSICFITPTVGWVAGRQEAPGGGSTGVVLSTFDGGKTWRQQLAGKLPGVNKVRFVDARTGFLLGDGTEAFPTGLFRTTDGGRSWEPIPGKRAPAWLDGDFTDKDTGALAGSWSRLAKLRGGHFTAADVDALGERSVRGLRILEQKAFAVGDGGLILSSRTGGGAWGFVDTKLPPDALTCLDFHAIDCIGDHAWVVGRPGSVLLRSADGGATWRAEKTGQPLPLYGVYFADPDNGWAVGALGTVLATRDGGKTWAAQRRGGRRTPLLFLAADPAGLPLETLARLGREEGYLASAVQVLRPDPKSAPPSTAAAGQRFAAAAREAGAAAGEALWQFPLPAHLADATPRQLVEFWDELHGRQAARQVLRQLVLAIRLWQPDVVVTGHPDPARGDSPGAAVLAEAMRRAFEMAADPKEFPEQIDALGLAPWRVSKVYAQWDGKEGADLSVDAGEVCPQLGGSAADAAVPAAALAGDRPPPVPDRRYFRLLDSAVPGAKSHQYLMAGLEGKADHGGRRLLPPAPELPDELTKALRARRRLQALADNPANPLAAPAQVLGSLKPVLEKLPRDQGAAAAFALAGKYARDGRWALAQETFLLMAEMYPVHPLTAEAYRWLILHNTSGEVRRRYELGQFVAENETALLPPAQGAGRPAPRPDPGDAPKRLPDDLGASDLPFEMPKLEVASHAKVTYLRNQADVQSAYQTALHLAARLQNFGPAPDPSAVFCLKAAQRRLGEVQKVYEWYEGYAAQNGDGPWLRAAAAEKWLAAPGPAQPKPVLHCRPAAAKPFLDGDFDDPCWQGLQPVVLADAVGATAGQNPTQARFAFDGEFLYLALECAHPPGHHVPAAKERPRDADLSGHDRVSILLDLDRDYTTCYHFQVDQRGCASEDCWGDTAWNPKWFVAVRSTKTAWHIEAAVPLAQLTGDPVRPGDAWACNVVRVLPARGVQSFSAPAEARPRPEGMGLLLFRGPDGAGDVRPAGGAAPPQ